MTEPNGIDKKEIERLLKEAVLAQERHSDLSKIAQTLEIVSKAISASVMDIAATLVTRLIIWLGGSIVAATAWFTFFIFGMRDSTRDLQRDMVDVNKTIASITLQLQKTSEISRENASSIREIIIRQQQEDGHQ